MSREAFEHFRRRVLADTALQEKLRATPGREAFLLLAVQTGRELGFDFTAEETAAALRDAHRAWLERHVRA